MSKPYYEDRKIPDEGPEDARILLVGEAAGEQEYEQRRPFIGPAGDKLMEVLGSMGVAREEVRLANLFHYRPFGNKFEAILQTEALKEGLRELYAYIERVKPYVIVPLGGWPLAFLTGKKGITKWRGSILPYIHDESIKCIPTFHPSAVLREREYYPTFKLDLRRVLSDSTFRDRNLPIRRFITDPRGLELEEWTQRLCESRNLACDIETVKKSNHIICVGFAPSPEVGVCILPTHPEGRSAIQRILLSNTRKIFQFGSFDYRQLTDNGFEIFDPTSEELDRLYYWDTLIAQHALVPELPRSLEYMTSVYTREPYYKTAGRGNIPDDTKGWDNKVDRKALYEYNARDCCCTYEVYVEQKREVMDNPAILDTFDFEMSCLEVADHISAAGLPVDESRRALLEDVLLTKWTKMQFVLDRMTGYETNVRSPKLKNILYDKDKMGLPTRRNRDGGITTDEDAIVSLISYCKDKVESLVRPDAILDWRVKLAVCETILKIRGVRQVLASYVLNSEKKPRIHEDGRMRSTYKVGGTETGRWAAMKYLDGKGINAMTLPRDPVEVPDEALTSEDKPAILRSDAERDIEDDEEVEEAA